MWWLFLDTSLLDKRKKRSVYSKGRSNSGVHGSVYSKGRSNSGIPRVDHNVSLDSILRQDVIKWECPIPYVFGLVDFGRYVDPTEGNGNTDLSKEPYQMKYVPSPCDQVCKGALFCFSLHPVGLQGVPKGTLSCSVPRHGNVQYRMFVRLRMIRRQYRGRWKHESVTGTMWNEICSFSVWPGAQGRSFLFLGSSRWFARGPAKKPSLA